MSLCIVSSCSLLISEINLTDNGETGKNMSLKWIYVFFGRVEEIDGVEIFKKSRSKPRVAVLSPGTHTFLIEGQYAGHILDSHLQFETEPGAIYTFYIFESTDSITFRQLKHELSGYIYTPKPKCY